MTDSVRNSTVGS